MSVYFAFIGLSLNCMLFEWLTFIFLSFLYGLFSLRYLFDATKLRYVLYQLCLLNSPKLFNKFTMYNADITKYSSIKLDYLFCIIGITLLKCIMNMWYLLMSSWWFWLRNWRFIAVFFCKNYKVIILSFYWNVL